MTPFNMFPVEGFVEDGFHPSLDEQVYRKDPAVAVSDIKDMTISPLHFYDKKVLGRRPMRTNAQEIGTLIHLAILEPDRFVTDVILEPADAPRRPTKAQIGAKKPSDDTLAAIAFWNDWDAKAAGKIVTDKETLDIVNEAKASVSRNQEAAELLDGATVELAMFHTVAAALGIKLRLKGKADIVSRGRWIADIKTVERGRANVDDFGSAIANWGYHMQAPWYIDLHNEIADQLGAAFTPDYVAKSGWKFIVVEKEPPFDVVVMELDSDDIRIGRDMNRRSIETLARCIKENRWPGGNSGGETVKMPAWAKRRMEG